MSSVNLSQAEIEEMLSRLRTEEPRSAPQAKQAAASDVADVQFPELAPQVNDTKKRNLNFFRAVPVKLSLELGRTTLTVREILQLEENSIIKLSSAAGDNATLCVNGKPLAAAEVVVINEDLGCRVVDFKLNASLGVED